MKTAIRITLTVLTFFIGALTCFVWPFLAAAIIWVDLGYREQEEDEERKAKERASKTNAEANKDK